MAQKIYKVPRLSDEQIAAQLEVLAEEFGEFSIAPQSFDIGVDTVNFPQPTSDAWKELISLKSELIHQFSGNILGVPFYYFRGGQHEPRSPFLDEILITVNGGKEQFKVAARILELFRPVQIPVAVEPQELVNVQRSIQESTFSRLQLLQEEMVSQTLSLRIELDKQFSTKETALEDMFKDKSNRADAEFELKRAALNAEREELDARRKTLDDSDNTFARRQIRDRMLAEVTNRVEDLKVSDATTKARGPVKLGITILISLLVMSIFWSYAEDRKLKLEESNLSTSVMKAQVYKDGVASGAEQSAEKSQTNQQRPFSSVTVPAEAYKAITQERILHWIRIALATLALIATLTYYIRWENQWAAQFANTEHSLRQFHIDISRANWVVETCLEWKKEHQSDIPPELVESLTRGLFADRSPATHVIHPADELASALMGSASRLSLDVAGNKIEIDKPKNIPKSKEIEPDS